MDRKEEMALRRLQRLVNRETDQARARFPSDEGLENKSPYVSLSVLAESIGKVNRCFNKLGMAADRETAGYWQQGLKEEVVRANSILDRIYLAFVEADYEST